SGGLGESSACYLEGCFVVCFQRALAEHRGEARQVAQLVWAEGTYVPAGDPRGEQVVAEVEPAIAHRPIEREDELLELSLLELNKPSVDDRLPLRRSILSQLLGHVTADLLRDA